MKIKFFKEFLNKKKSPRKSDHWCRMVMEGATADMIDALKNKENMEVLEISGNKWENAGFKKYKSIFYPDIDICKDVLAEKFDLIIAEQVFEHLIYPYRAAKNIFSMLKDGGYLLITTPFLIRNHPEPNDCTRWTENGMRYFLEESGFNIDKIESGSWGNRECVIANLDSWIIYDERKHSLANDQRFPMVVWAIAKK
jgi:SAM-dependent methyltransferase